MKRILIGALTTLMVTLCAACNSSERIADGTWYSIPDVTMFMFEDGKVTCAGQIVGQYENNGKSIILSLLNDLENTELYITKVNKIDVLTDASNGEGNIYFCKGIENAKQLVKEAEEAAREAAKFKPPEADLVTYDSIVAGEHAGEIVAVEALVDDCYYDSVLERYKFYFGYWSDQENLYVYPDADFGTSLFVDGCIPEAIAPLATFEKGDRIKLVVKVCPDNSFGLSDYYWSELIEKAK